MDTRDKSKSVPAKLEFPEWLTYEAIREKASELWSQLPKERDPATAQKVLTALVNDPRMKRVWAELYRRRRRKGQPYLNAAVVANIEASASLRKAAAKATRPH